MSNCCIIRADGSVIIGHGHVFRTLTLAAELAKRGWQVVYVCRELEGAPLDRVRDAGHGLEILGPDIDEEEDARRTAEVAARVGASWIVVDRYATDHRAHLLWRERGLKILAIDDICEHPFPIDILLNQNTDAQDLPYQTSDETVRLFGPKYALVREAYRKARPKAPRIIDEVRRVMVFMGGSDPSDATGKVLEALESFERVLEVVVVVGAAYPFFDRLGQVAQSSKHQVIVHRDLPDLVGPMSRADVAVAAGGSVTWEFCCMGVPMVLLPVADNQEGIAASTERRGASKRIGWHSFSGPKDELIGFIRNVERLNAMAPSAYALVDGLGVSRVSSLMKVVGCD